MSYSTTRDGHEFNFDRESYATVFFDLLGRYGIPPRSFAATEVWVEAAYGRFASAEDEARLWSYCWHDFKAGHRSDWIPRRGDLDASANFVPSGLPPRHSRPP